MRGRAGDPRRGTDVMVNSANTLGHLVDVPGP
jgi:hypothetical protein